MKRISFFVLLALLFATVSFAQPYIITEQHTYVLGDNDSINDARTICYMQAQRKIIEKSGVYVTSHTQVNNGAISKAEINSYAAALLNIESSKPQWGMNESGSMTVTLTLTANVDPEAIGKKISEIQQDDSARQKIIDQQKKLNTLEESVKKLQQQLDGANTQKAVTLRKDRNLLFNEIDDLQQEKKNIMQRMSNEKKAQEVTGELVELKMLMPDVYKLLGMPAYTGIDKKTFTYCLDYELSSVKFDRGHRVDGVFEGLGCTGKRIK